MLMTATLGIKREENGARRSKVVTTSTTLVSVRALKRAQQAMRCLPFRRAFYDELEHEARSSTQLSSQHNWMAITERVRLTPMGRDLLDGWKGEIPTADALQVMHHWLRRHRPRL
jgi:hypothetical protein